MPPLRYAQLRYLVMIMTSWLIVFFLIRRIPQASHLSDVNSGFSGVLGILGIDLVHDLSFFIYAISPLALYPTLCSLRMYGCAAGIRGYCATLPHAMSPPIQARPES